MRRIFGSRADRCEIFRLEVDFEGLRAGRANVGLLVRLRRSIWRAFIGPTTPRVWLGAAAIDIERCLLREMFHVEHWDSFHEAFSLYDAFSFHPGVQDACKLKTPGLTQV